MGALSLAALACYLVLASRYPIAPSLAQPRATWASLAGPDASWLLVQLAINLSLSVIYSVAIRLLTSPVLADSRVSANPPRQSRWLYGVIGLAWLAWSAGLMTMAPAGESHDLFDYVFRGRMMVELHGNPLAEPPSGFNTKPFYLYIAWHDSVDTYGPLWEMMSAGVAMVVQRVAQGLGWFTVQGPSCPDTPASCRLLLVYLTGYRLLACALTALCGGMIAAIVRPRQPGFVPAALVAWLWNPLTLFSTALGGHNDPLWIALFLVSLWLLQRERPFWALFVLILAAHVKLMALLWAPVYGLWTLRKWGWRRTLGWGSGALALGLAVSWLLYLPFGGWSTLPRMVYERTLYVANSPSEVVYHLWKDAPGWRGWVGLRLSTTLPNWLFAGSGLLFLMWRFNILPRRWRRHGEPVKTDDTDLWSSIVWVGLLYLAVGAFWFQPWYFLWVLAPAALLPARAATRTVIPWLSFGAVVAIPAGSFLLAAPLPFTPSLVSAVVVAIIWGPGILAGSMVYLTGHTKLGRRLQQVRQTGQLTAPDGDWHTSH